MPELKKVEKKVTKKVTEETDDLKPVESESAKEAVEKSTKLLDDIDALLDQDAVLVLKQALKDDKGKPLTLADLMREGASVTDQAIGAWTRPSGETCALSAAMLAARARGLA